jgi:long-chain acyl-CoA synthetase
MFDLIQYGNKLCLEGNGLTLSYQDVHQAVEVMRPSFEGRNVILCLCENSVPALVGYIGFMVHRQVPILIEAGLQPAALQHILEDYAPEFAWLPESRKSDLPLGEVVHRNNHYVLVQLSGQRETVLFPDLQLLLTTSGSTGSRKFVRVSRRNLMANATSIVEFLGIRYEDVAITTLPFSYSFGLSIINSHLLVGASVQVTELNPLSREFWTLAEEKHITSLSGVPYTWEMLRRIKFERFQLDALRYLSQAGGRMSDEGLAYLTRVSIERGWSCFVMYGQTEATARMSYLLPAWLAEKSTSIGHAIPGGRFEILNEAGQVSDVAYEKGELVYYGSNVTLGYANTRADLAKGDEWNGRLPTGDLAYRDEDGCYYITGRLKRFVKLFGNRVSLDEVEKLLHAFFKQGEFVCSGKDDSLQIAFVGSIEASDLLTFISRQLSIHRSAIKCKKLREIPRLSNGKIDYAALGEVERALL